MSPKRVHTSKTQRWHHLDAAGHETPPAAAERSAVSTAPAAVMEAEKRKAGVLQTPEEEKPLFMAEIDRQMVHDISSLFVEYN